MKKQITGLAVVMLFGMLVPSMVSAGYEITRSSSTMHGAKQSKIFISKNKYKVVNEESQMIVNFADNRMIITNENKKSYWEGTIDEYIKELHEMYETSMKHMQEVLKKMPEAQKEQIMTMHGLNDENQKINVTIKKTGQTEDIAGYKAEKYVVYNNGQSFEQVWIAKGLNVSGEINPKKLQEFSAKIKKSTMGGATEGAVGLSKAYIKLFEQGYPVKQVFDNNIMTMTVAGIKKTDVPDKLFTAPAGYKRTDSIKEFFMGEHKMMMH